MYLVEDHVLIANGIKRQANLDEAARVDVVGHSLRNTSDLLAKIAAAQPDVALVDLCLGDVSPWGTSMPVEYDGIAAGRRIRDEFGNRLKIVLYTNFPNLRNRAVAEVSPDLFLAKADDVDLLRTVRDAHLGTVAIRALAAPQNLIERMEIELGQRVVRLHGQAPANLAYTLEPAAFALLQYLAEERQARQKDWLVKSNDYKGSLWQVKHADRWREICKMTGSEWGGATAILPEVVTRCLHKINRPCKHWLGGPPVKGGRGGVPTAGRPDSAQLRQDVSHESIVIK